MLQMHADDYCHTVDEVISNLADGFRVIFPRPDELFLDLDSGEAYDRYRSMYSLLSSLLQPHDGLRSFETVSKSGLPNRHIRITLPGEMTMEQRFIFQLALGSDPARELMNYASYLNGEHRPSIFVEPACDDAIREYEEAHDGAI